MLNVVMICRFFEVSGSEGESDPLSIVLDGTFLALSTIDDTLLEGHTHNLNKPNDAVSLKSF